MSARRLGLDHIDLYYLHTPTMTDAPFEEIVETLAGMRQDGLIRHIGLSNVSAEQLGTAMSITDIAAVTVHYNVAVRLGAAVRQVAQDAGIVFSPYHPGAIPPGHEGEPFHTAIDPIAAEHDVTPQQVALAWQLHRTTTALPIPGTTGVQHLHANLAAASISLTQAEVDAVTVHYNVAVRLGAAVRQVAQDAGIVFSPWHPGAIPGGNEGRPFHAVIDPIAERYDATPQQIALAWQLHRTERALPIPGTTSIQHLKENLAAAHISLTPDEVDAITALAPEEN